MDDDSPANHRQEEVDLVLESRNSQMFHELFLFFFSCIES